MIQSGYNPQGGNMLTTSGGFAPPSLPGVPGLPFDPSAAIREKLRREAEQTAFENKLRQQEADARQKQLQMQQRQFGMEEQSFKDSRRYADQDRARMMNHAATPKAPVKRPDYGPTPASFGRLQMNHTGNWGTFVDPANIPVGLQDKIMGGMYGQSTNWDSSNPSIMGPQQFSSQKYTHSGGGGSMASIGPGGVGAKPAEDPLAHLSPYEQARLQQVAFASKR